MFPARMGEHSAGMRQRRAGRTDGSTIRAGAGDRKPSGVSSSGIRERSMIFVPTLPAQMLLNPARACVAIASKLAPDRSASATAPPAGSPLSTDTCAAIP